MMAAADDSLGSAPAKETLANPDRMTSSPTLRPMIFTWLNIVHQFYAEAQPIALPLTPDVTSASNANN